jgi:hypothetical protein
MIFKIQRLYYNTFKSQYIESLDQEFLLDRAIRAITIDSDNKLGRIFTDYDPQYPIIVKAQDALEIVEKLQAQTTKSKDSKNE